MKRPAHIWLAFAAFGLLAMASLGWLSRAVLRLDASQRQAASENQREELVRLALWRMDSALALLVADENAHPAAEYVSFFPAPRAWSSRQPDLPEIAALLPSPLLVARGTNVRMHFEFAPGRPPTSPQVPENRFGALAIADGQTPAELEKSTARLQQLRTFLEAPSVARPVPASSISSSTKAADHNQDVLASNAAAAFTNTPSAEGLGDESSNPENALRYQLSQASVLNRAEFQARANNLGNAQQAYRYNQGTENAEPGAVPPPRLPASADASLKVGSFTPTWLGEELFLVRRVAFRGGHQIQGVWLDWPALRESLLASVRDIVPGASILPLQDPAPDADERHLVAIPARLVIGMLPDFVPPRWTALRLALLAAWIGMVVAMAAVGVLVQGILALSERRAEFVSAVTHELRTPLTTFRLYSEMLAEEMVGDPAQRREYLATLCAEAGRLGHLVENVLAYARLERGSARNRRERISLGRLIERVVPRLETRAAQGGFELRVDADAKVSDTGVDVDIGVVEQILFNLVDNAVKYAGGEGSVRILHLEALPERGKCALLRVRDHGQGIGADVAGRLFEPFHRSAEKAAGSAPGVGLGLALCRKLSRSLGGDLRHDRSVQDGAAFVLGLPRAPV